MRCYSIKFGGTHLYTWMERDTVRVRCVVQVSRPGLEPGPLDPGTTALTMRPPHLHLVAWPFQIVYHSDLTNHSCIWFPVGAAFGKGVYFARDAAYSYLYATRSGENHYIKNPSRLPVVAIYCEYIKFSPVESIYLISILFMYPEASKRRWKLSYSLLLLQQMSFLEVNN